MATFTSQTLIRSAALFSAAAKPRAVFRCFSALPESSSRVSSEVEAKAVEKIEDLIHNIIATRCRPDWLPLVPGASYWVPPRRSSYGIADIVHNIANAPTEEEYLSLVTLQGWPSSGFYLQDDESSHSDLMEAKTSSTETFHEEEG